MVYEARLKENLKAASSESILLEREILEDFSDRIKKTQGKEPEDIE